MPAWLWAADAVGAMVVLVLLFGVLLVLRRRLLTRGGGTFEMSVRIHQDVPGRGWALGMGRYEGNELQWFRIFMPTWRPSRAWRRTDLTFSGRRVPTDNEKVALYAGQVVVVCETPDGPVELAMSEAALTGWLSWLEAGPPGQRAGQGG